MNRSGVLFVVASECPGIGLEGKGSGPVSGCVVNKLDSILFHLMGETWSVLHVVNMLWWSSRVQFLTLIAIIFATRKGAVLVFAFLVMRLLGFQIQCGNVKR